MKTDYHFHPNLHAKNPEKRLRRIWDAITTSGLDAIICTEHAYKNAPDAYRRLIATKPTNAQAHIYPGVELITNEGKGIEIIAFAEHDWYDDHPLLLKPFAMNLSEMLTYLQDSDLQWFVPHPFLPGNPLKRLFPDEGSMLDFLSQVPAFEMQNGCYLLLEKFFEYMPWTWLHNVEKKLRDSVQLSQSLVKNGEHAFYAIGSDAHHPRDLGFYVDITTSKPQPNRTEAFQVLITNKTIDAVHVPSQCFSLRHLLYTGWTTFSESCMKREWHRYAYQHEVFEIEPAAQHDLTTTRSLVLDGMPEYSQVDAREA